MKFTITAEFKTIMGATVKMETQDVYSWGLEGAISEILAAHYRASRIENVPTGTPSTVGRAPSDAADHAPQGVSGPKVP